MFLNLYRLVRKIREKLFVLSIRGSFANFGARSSLGLPVTVWGQDRISIGRGVYVGPNSWLQVMDEASGSDGPVITLQDGVSIAGAFFVSARKGVIIEENVLMGRFVHISDHSHRFDDPELPVKHQGITEAKPVRICSGAWLGQGVVILPGVTIGRNSVIGANSVVRSDVPDFSVAVGSPARVVRSRR